MWQGHASFYASLHNLLWRRLRKNTSRQANSAVSIERNEFYMRFPPTFVESMSRMPYEAAKSTLNAKLGISDFALVGISQSICRMSLR